VTELASSATSTPTIRGRVMPRRLSQTRAFSAATSGLWLVRPMGVPSERARHTREWQLSERALERFLAALDRDRDAAAEHYERIRSRLLRFFEWRGCEFPDEHADETITRVIRKIDEGAAIEDPDSYCYGVARLVRLEALKERERARDALAQMQPLAVCIEEVQQEVERRVGCLHACMKRLPSDQQSLIAEYYRHDSGARIEARKRLAASLGIGLNALRIRAHRLSDRLGSCIGECLGHREPA
jgi:DNA-directed RNA polymerase specialized sigma24 family protein